MYIILMVVLLGCSAFFSGSETAFFHLSQRTIRQFDKSKKKLERLTAITLSNPSRFLTAMLFGNMLVNVLYFAITSTFSFQFVRSAGPAAGMLTATGGFVLLLLFGEMLPKSLAYTNARQFCLCAAPACYLFLKILGPLLFAIDLLIVQPVIRLFVRPQRDAGVSTNQLKTLLDSSRRQGLISSDENQLLAEILKFSFLKVRHVMQPRVEMPSCSIRTSVNSATKEMLEKNLVKMPVYTESVDSVVGFIHLKDLFLNPKRPLSTMVRHAQFVPEQKSVESLIDFFRQTKTDAAMVVDEYGGVAGWVEQEDIMEQLLGPLENASEADPIEQIGPMKYRLRANLPIHEWMEAFGIDIKEERQVTIGGFVIALLGKIPKEGDEVVFQNIKFTVERTRQNRIQAIILSLGSLDNKGGQEK
ncbi:MAG: HlyC/CorC family transporter [Planctomycetes bacterium]|nr:HlyC/CorC family transporter [Planctomycetota bacterium]